MCLMANVPMIDQGYTSFVFHPPLTNHIQERILEIIRLDPMKKKKATDVLVAAFFDYPMFDLYFPDRNRRKKTMTWYLGKVLNCALSYGEVYTTPEISGVIFTLPPGHTKISQWEYIQNGFLPSVFVLGVRDFVRSQACEEYVANEHERLMKGREHYYLWGLVVDPPSKRQGVGTALLKPFIEKADAEKMPIYLETHDERNVDYYQRMDFQLVATSKIPKSEVPIWCMVREPE
jgi:GNAT superfamily N-acetyltransferase